MFFNDGTANATPSDFTGDIIAGVNLERNSKLGDRIIAFVARCDQAPCADPEALKVVTFAGTWAMNTPVSVTVRVEEGDQGLPVQGGRRNAGADVRRHPALHRELPKNVLFPLGVQTTVANCMAERLEASFGALFDNVSINATVVNALSP